MWLQCSNVGLVELNKWICDVSWNFCNTSKYSLIRMFKLAWWDFMLFLSFLILNTDKVWPSALLKYSVILWCSEFLLGSVTIWKDQGWFDGSLSERKGRCHICICAEQHTDATHRCCRKKIKKDSRVRFPDCSCFPEQPALRCPMAKTLHHPASICLYCLYFQWEC